MTRGESGLLLALSFILKFIVSKGVCVRKHFDYQSMYTRIEDQ